MKLNFYSALLLSGFLLSPISGYAQITIKGKAPFYQINDGPDQDLTPVVLDECKKTIPFAQIVKLVKDDKPWFASRKRDYECYIVDLDKDTVRPTSLQQRVMQTRKFNKSHDAVHRAITSWGKDSGANVASAANPKVMKIDGAPHPVMVTGNVVHFHYAGMTIALMLDFDLNPKSESVTEVRLRTRYAGNGVNTEIFNQNHYKYIFNGIGQQMFVEAIEIDPQEVK
jgi:hypothetical protein